MPDLDNMLTMLESATVDTDKLNEAVDYHKLASTFFNLSVELSTMSTVPAYQIAELTALVNKVRQVRITDEFRVITYPKIHNLGDSYSLNITCLFDYVIKAIRDHTKDPSKPFNQELVNKKAIAHALKQCTGKHPSEYLDLNGFKYQYQLAVFGNFRKVSILPRLAEMTTSALKVPIILKYIDNKLIYRHISSLNQYHSDMIKEFKKIQKINPESSEYLSRYTKCIETAIRNTLQIYKIMRNTYFMLDVEYKRIFNHILAKDKSLNTPMQESVALVETAKFISSNVKPLKNISMQISNTLLESADPLQMQESSNQISESLKKFVKEFKEAALKTKIDRQNIRQWHLESMGPTLLQLGEGKHIVDPNFLIPAYDGINKAVNINGLSTQFSKNLVLLQDILEHCDKYKNQTVKFYIEQFIPSSLHSCIPDADINLIGVLLTNISSKICGKHRYINPDIDVISNNIVSIPGFLGVIDSHINNIIELVCSKIDSIIGVATDESKMVIDNIINAFFAYLAIILNIYRDLTIIEDSALAAVDYISKANP